MVVLIVALLAALLLPIRRQNARETAYVHLASELMAAGGINAESIESDDLLVLGEQLCDAWDDGSFGADAVAALDGYAPDAFDSSDSQLALRAAGFSAQEELCDGYTDHYFDQPLDPS